MKLVKLLCCGIALLSLGVSAYAVDISEIARFNLDALSADNATPEYIGSNPSALAWDGSRLFVAGFNNSGSLAENGIIEVLSATQTGVVDTPTFGPRLRSLLTPAFRGYISLDISADGDSLVAAYDFGSSTPDGFQMYNTSDGSLRWDASGRGSSGAAFDPGFAGADSGAAFGAFGSGRRLLNDTATGSPIYDSTNGLVWYDNNGPGTFVRDIDFDPQSGDVYVRHNNQVSKATRTGGNAASPNGVIVPLGVADFVSHQTIAFMGNVATGGSTTDLLVFNDRAASAAGQEFADVIKVANSDGSPVSPNFTFLNSETPLAGSGWYDFDFDPGTGTLALLDNSNRNVHIFDVGDTGSTLACDFNADMSCNGVDIDMLVENIAIGPSDPSTYDLNSDGNVDIADRDQWLALAGAENLASMNPYLLGDANLDGIVDGLDFIDWNDNKFTSVAAWTSGDFTADGVVDGLDFIEWNGNKFMSSDLSAVPEPANLAILAMLTGLVAGRRSR